MTHREEEMLFTYLFLIQKGFKNAGENYSVAPKTEDKEGQGIQD